MSVQNFVVKAMTIFICTLPFTSVSAQQIDQYPDKIYTVTLERLVCFDTQEVGEDEIYLQVSIDGLDKVRYPSSGSISMDEGSDIYLSDVPQMNTSWKFAQQIEIEIWEDDGCDEDDCADDELIGTIRRPSRQSDWEQTEAGVTKFRDDGDYDAYWREWKVEQTGTHGSSTRIDGPDGQNVFNYTLLPGKAALNVVGTGFTRVKFSNLLPGIVSPNSEDEYVDLYFTWYDDGTYTFGKSPESLGKVLGTGTYTTAPGQTPDHIVAIAITKKLSTENFVFTWYRDGTYSRGKPQSLGSHNHGKEFNIPGDNILPTRIIDITMDKFGYTRTWYDTGYTSNGIAANLGAMESGSFPQDWSISKTRWSGNDRNSFGSMSTGEKTQVNDCIVGITFKDACPTCFSSDARTYFYYDKPIDSSDVGKCLKILD